MDSFELNTVLGAILATCLVLLVVNFSAQAIFSPTKLEKPGFDIAVKEEATDGGAKEAAAPSESRRARHPPRNAPPAIPSRRAVRTGSARIFSGLSARTEAKAAGSISRPP
jgi:hypothetical protein